MAKQKIVTILRGHEYMPKNEVMVFSTQPNRDEKQHSVLESTDNFFYDVYTRAKRNVDQVLQSQEQFKKIQQMEDIEKSLEAKENADEMQRLNNALLCAPNNVIAFCGDRGEGKTSAMLSFTTALENFCKEKNDEVSKNEKKFWGDRIIKKNFEVLSCIDPTSIEEKDKFLKVVLSYMFNQFKAAWEKKQRKAGYQLQESTQLEGQRILELFQKCYQDMETLEEEITACGYDGLEEILDSSKYKWLRGTVFQLVQKYLRYMGKDVLVIQIDDADLNIGRTYEIVETIRKYLFLPNVIVMLAVNMRQLESTVEQDFLKAYQVSVQLGGAVDASQCYHIAERYVDKVIPGSRRIDLPKLDGRQNMKIAYFGEKQEDLLKAPKAENWGFQEQLLHFMYARTGIVFIVSENLLHPILPRSMRELTHFLNFFENLKKKVSARNAVSQEIVQYNLEQMKYYLIEIWGAYHLTNETRSFLRDFYREENTFRRHKNVIVFLEEYYCNAYKKKSADFYKNQFRQLCLNAGVSGKADDKGKTLLEIDATYANVMEILYLIEEELGTTDARDTVYAIRMAYTITLHEIEWKYSRGDGILQEVVMEYTGNRLLAVQHLLTNKSKAAYSFFPISGQLLKYWINTDTARIYDAIRELCLLYSEDGECEALPAIKYDNEGKIEIDNILWVNACNPLFLNRTGASIIWMNWDMQNELSYCMWDTLGINPSFFSWLLRFYWRMQIRFESVDYIWNENFGWFAIAQDKEEKLNQAQLLDVGECRVYPTEKAPLVFRYQNLAWAMQFSNPSFLKRMIDNLESAFLRYQNEKTLFEASDEWEYSSSIQYRLSLLDGIKKHLEQMEKTGRFQRFSPVLFHKGPNIDVTEGNVQDKLKNLQTHLNDLCLLFLDNQRFDDKDKTLVDRIVSVICRELDRAYIVIKRYVRAEEDNCKEIIIKLQQGD